VFNASPMNKEALGQFLITESLFIIQPNPTSIYHSNWIVL